MKKLLFSLMAIVAVITTACEDKNAYTISGTIEANDSSYVYLTPLTYFNDYVKLDSALVINGKFEMKGIASKSELRMIITSKMRAFIFIEPGNIKMDITDRSVVQGTPLNDELQKLDNEVALVNDRIKEMRKNLKQLQENKDEAALKAWQAEITELRQKTSDIYKDYIRTNINRTVGSYLFLVNMNSFSNEEILEFIPKLVEDVKNLEAMQLAEKSIKEQEIALRKVAIGQKFVDFKAKDLKGNDSALSDFAGKGKVILVDFWASWCGPCRAQMPRLIETYKKYKGKDFEIIGVSLDNNQADWEKGTDAMNITWPQISDLKMWKSEAVTSYAIKGIPHLVLLDKEGTIVAKDIHGKELDEKIAEILK